MITTKWVHDVTVMSSSSEEKQGSPVHYPENVTFQLRTEELVEGTLILFFHKKTKGDIEFWSWKDIQGLISLLFSWTLKAKHHNKYCSQSSRFSSPVLYMQQWCSVGQFLNFTGSCHLSLTNHPGLPDSIQVSSLKFPHPAKTFNHRPKRNRWSPTNKSLQYLLGTNIDWLPSLTFLCAVCFIEWSLISLWFNRSYSLWDGGNNSISILCMKCQI